MWRTLRVRSRSAASGTFAPARHPRPRVRVGVVGEWWGGGGGGDGGGVKSGGVGARGRWQHEDGRRPLVVVWARLFGCPPACVLTSRHCCPPVLRLPSSLPACSGGGYGARRALQPCQGGHLCLAGRRHLAPPQPPARRREGWRCGGRGGRCGAAGRLDARWVSAGRHWQMPANVPSRCCGFLPQCCPVLLLSWPHVLAALAVFKAQGSCLHVSPVMQARQRARLRRSCFLPVAPLGCWW